MIKPININSVNSSKSNPNKQTPFNGSILEVAVAGLQACEANPMLMVTAADLTTAIAPRTIIEGKTNPHAGFEAFRRESSGLIINCLIPGLIVAGVAKAIQGPIMGNKSKMADCWANEDTINMVSKYWEKAEGNNNREKVSDTFRRILNDIQGADGENTVIFKGKDFEDSIEKMTDEVFKQDMPKGWSLSAIKARRAAKKASQSEISKVFEAIINQTHTAENIKIGGSAEYFSQGLGSIVENTPKILKELVNGASPKDFIRKATNLVTAKSLMGLGIIIPLAISAQPINRWITAKTSGKKGAPIYKDFTQSQQKELSNEEKSALTKQKIISISSMVGVALLSIMKMPSMAMLKSITQFKGIFPSMDQARIISTATFASRMGASEDKNDLREATVRDIATFSAFYFLGDYVAKGIATGIQKFKGVKLINELKALPKDSNVLEKIWHWTKNTALKSSNEIHGATPELTNYAKKMRGLCQLGNLAFSLVALGLVIPKMNRKKTDKEREKELKRMGVDQTTINKYYPSFEMKMNVKNTKNSFNTFPPFERLINEN